MVISPGVVPARGDVIWLNFKPQAGHEQAGRRPALIISPLPYNRKVGLVLCCPITSQAKGYPFEVTIPDSYEVSGVVLSDQVKCLDWRARDAELICRLPDSVVRETIEKLLILLE
ncbi:MAG: endoribonuclease MazF [bacterium]